MTRHQGLAPIAVVMLLVAATSWADTQSDENGCYSHISKATYPIGFKGLHECKEYECTENDWQPTGVVDEKCTNTPPGEGCYSHISKETYPIGFKGSYQCHVVYCTENGWHTTDEQTTDCDVATEDLGYGCWVEITKEQYPEGHIVNHKCAEYKCENRYYQPTGAKQTNCTEKHEKKTSCYSHISDANYEIGFIGSYRCKQVICTEYDWQITDKLTADCEVATEDPGYGCWISVGGIHEVYPEGAIKNHKCLEMKCVNRKWEPTGGKQANCTEILEKKTSCYSYISKEHYPIGFIGSYRCQEVMCTENDWKHTGKTNPDCVYSYIDPGKGCWDKISYEMFPTGHIVYKNCVEYMCSEDRNYKATDVRDPSCGEINEVDENEAQKSRIAITAALTSDAPGGSSGTVVLSVIGAIGSLIILVGAVLAVYVYVLKPKRLRVNGRDGPASDVQPSDLDNTSSSLQEE